MLSTLPERTSDRAAGGWTMGQKAVAYSVRELHSHVDHYIGSVGIAEIAGEPIQIIRQQDASCCTGVLRLAMQTSGRCVVSQDGRDASLVPGDFAVLDTRRSYQLTFDRRYQCLIVDILPDLLPMRSTDLRSLTARRVPGHDGIGKLTRQFLTGIAQQAVDRDLRTNHDLASAVINLVTAALVAQLNSDVVSTLAENQRQSLLRKIKAFIEAHLAEPELSPAEIARAHHISLRYLQKLFESEGTTVSDWVRRQRLEHCRTELADPRYRAVSIGAIAGRWGFVDSSYFSRVFKATYGATPREFRSDAFAGGHPAGRIVNQVA